MTRKELLKSPVYWITQVQIQMYEVVTGYILARGMSIAQFSKKSGISRYKLQQIANGDYKGTVEEMVKILMSCGVVPKITIENLKDQI